MGTRGEVHLLAFLLVVVFSSLPPGSTQESNVINKCLQPKPPDCGPYTYCFNEPGSYHCTCMDGYTSSSGKDRFRKASENDCQDINECVGPKRTECGPHATCTNVPGSYHCTCISGYKSSSGTAKFRSASTNDCQEIDQCVGLSQPVCGLHANCTNVPGGYNCTCLDGYESSSGTANFRSASENDCQDIDECQQNATICEPNGNCINVPGSYMCKCKLGFGKSIEDPKICKDIDECQQYNSTYICGSNTTCVNTPGSYKCVCMPGYIRYNPSSCKVSSFNCSAELEKIKKTQRNSGLGQPSSSSSFSSFLNSAFEILNSTCEGGSAESSLKQETLPFNTLLNTTLIWAGGSTEEVASVVNFMLKSVELVTLASAYGNPGRKTQHLKTESMAIETRLITQNCSRKSNAFTLGAHEEKMDIHCETVTEAAQQEGFGAAAVFISYSTLDSIINMTPLCTGNSSAGGKLNSRVVSGAIGDGRCVRLANHVNFTLLHKQVIKEKEAPHCVYWKFKAGKGIWSPDGCTVLDTNSTHTTCSCDHLSSFAILMAPSTVPTNGALIVLTRLGLTFSLLCLLLAILTFLLCRSIRNVSTSIHLQLCFCLFLASLLFLTAVDRTSSQVVCAVIAGFLHYLFLACFTWMFLEGLHLFLTVRNLRVVNYTSASRFKKRHMYPFGYGFPALIVAVSAALKPEGYGTKDYCWLNLQKGFHWSFLGPVCAIILMNITFFALTLWILRSKLSTLNTDVSTLRDHRLLAFKAIAQVFILGCTWSLGLLQIGSAATVMAYLFTIINSLQGAFIFLVHCLLNHQVREEYRRWIKGVRKSSTIPQTQDISMSIGQSTGTKTERDPLQLSKSSL